MAVGGPAFAIVCATAAGRCDINARRRPAEVGRGLRYPVPQTAPIEKSVTQSLWIEFRSAPA
jgi:hypothetical protein